jgi:hypothetical protein
MKPGPIHSTSWKSAGLELTRFPAHLLLSHRSRFEVGW